MPDDWVPPPTDRVEINLRPPRATPAQGGREALVISCAAAFCLALALAVSSFDNSTGGKIPWATGVITVCMIVSVPVGILGFVRSVLSWKTRLGRTALGLNLGMVLLIASVMLIVGHK